MQAVVDGQGDNGDIAEVRKCMRFLIDLEAALPMWSGPALEENFQDICKVFQLVDSVSKRAEQELSSTLVAQLAIAEGVDLNALGKEAETDTKTIVCEALPAHVSDTLVGISTSVNESLIMWQDLLTFVRAADKVSQHAASLSKALSLNISVSFQAQVAQIGARHAMVGHWMRLLKALPALQRCHHDVEYKDWAHTHTHIGGGGVEGDR